MPVPPFNVVADRIDFVLLGDYHLKSNDEHMRMLMCDYFTGKWYDDTRKDWADFGQSEYWTARRTSRRTRQRLTKHD